MRGEDACPIPDRAPNWLRIAGEPAQVLQQASFVRRIVPEHRAEATVRAEDEFRATLVWKTASLCKTLGSKAGETLGTKPDYLPAEFWGST